MAIVAATLLVSSTHERRVAKMAGPAAEPVYAGAGRLWAMLLVAVVAATFALLMASRPGRLFELWSIAVGAGLILWGRNAAFGWYVGLGALLAAAGIADVALAAASGDFPVGFRVLVAGLVVPVAAVITNRRFLWFRPAQRG